MTAVLEGITILDLSRLLPGPFCTQVLGDLGAEVIKIENPDGGDYIRWYPPLGKAASAHYYSVNRNKKSIRLNLDDQRGREIFRSLASRADVIVEQFRPGVLQGWGLGYQELQAINPRVILCSISGYGQTGPYKYKAGHDLNYLSTAGVLDQIGKAGEPPVIPGIQIADITGALWSIIGILAALRSRDATGCGQWVDISMLDAVFSYNALQVGSYYFNNQLPTRGQEPLSGGCAWYRIYKTLDDSYLALAMLEFKFWRQFCKAIGREQFIEQQYAPFPVQAQMIAELSTLFASKPIAEWLDLFKPLDICISQVNHLAEALADDHLQQRSMILEIPDPAEGIIQTIGFPMKLSATPCKLYQHPPAFGEHTAAVLKSLGYNEEDIAALSRDGVI